MEKNISLDRVGGWKNISLGCGKEMYKNTSLDWGG